MSSSGTVALRQLAATNKTQAGYSVILDITRTKNTRRLSSLAMVQRYGPELEQRLPACQATNKSWRGW
jgi:hypothetical protein